jgi:hypothetical protein
MGLQARSRNAPADDERAWRPVLHGEDGRARREEVSVLSLIWMAEFFKVGQTFLSAIGLGSNAPTPSENPADRNVCPTFFRRPERLGLTSKILASGQ